MTFAVSHNGRMPHDEVVMARSFCYAPQRQACTDADMARAEDPFVFEHDSAISCIWD